MIKPPAGESETGRDVLDLQIRQFFDHLCRRQPGREQVQHIRHSNAQAAHTRAASALFGVHGDPFGKGGHRRQDTPRPALTRRSCRDQRESVEIHSGATHGQLPPPIQRLVLEWAALHRAELLENWQRARQGQPLVRIAPLE